ncbi:MAG: hypothetical protein HZB16_11110 [Armatimonadetes bacterium]|nr:hypothetical protein [Armatimonadota bacterium]
MNKLLTSLLAAALALAPAGARCFLVTSHSPDRVAIVDNDGKLLWQCPMNHAQDAAVLPDGSIVCAVLNGVRKVNRDQQTLWTYTVPEGCQNPVAQPLDGGLVLVGNEGPCRLLEVDAEGKAQRTVQMTSGFKGNHGQFRFCRKTPEGTYLAPMFADNTVREFAADGTQLWKLDIGGPVSAVRLPGGNTVVGSFEGVTEYDKEHRLIWKYACAEVPAPDKVSTVTAVVRLRNGNTIFAHYTGDGDKADLFEVTAEKQIVWRLALPDTTSVAMVQVLDDHWLPSADVLAR